MQCYKAGIKPLEFDDMTVEQAVVFLDCQSESRIEQFKDNVLMLDGLAKQIVSGVAGLFDKKAKMLTRNKLYPELFSENQSKNNNRNLSQSEIWLRFLYG